MCGLVAVISKKNWGFIKRDIDIFTQLLYADRLRGKDGTGIFYNNKKHGHSVRTLRAPCASPDFINTKEYESAMDIALKDSTFLVGHNRAATKGTLTVACTHPFREKHIVLVHNGTLNTHDELSKGSVVDSHAICVHMANKGVKDTLSKINGAFALIWADTNKGTLNFCRNSERPLYILETSNLFILCSEEDLGKWICSRNNEKIISSKSALSGTLYTIDIKDTKSIKEESVKYKTKFSHFFTYEDDYTQRPLPVPAISHKKNSNYKEGEWVKFKPSIIIQQNTAYLSGYILSDKNTPIVERTPHKYEDLARVRVYGNMEYLRELCKKEHLIGKIESTMAYFGIEQIVLNTVDEETNIIDINKNLIKEEDCKHITSCDFCSKIFDEKNPKRYLIDDFILCKGCADDMYAATQGTSHNYCSC